MFGQFAKLALATLFIAGVAIEFARSYRPAPKPPVQEKAVVARPAPAPAPVPAPPPPTQRRAGGEYAIAANSVGQYTTDAEVNGSRIHMLVDTGASSVALSYEDAAAAGLFPAPADYKYSVSTANGTGRVARVKLRTVRVGGITINDVDAFVGERGALHASLLGMTFLSKLTRFEIAGGSLLLKQ